MNGGEPRAFIHVLNYISGIGFVCLCIIETYSQILSYIFSGNVIINKYMYERYILIQENTKFGSSRISIM